MLNTSTVARFNSMILVFAVVTVLSVTTAGPVNAQVNGLDLNGTWSAGNLGTFFIRQIGDQIWWLGEDDPIQPTWCQIGHGKMEGKLITMDWIDLPKGLANLQGTVVFEVTYPNRIVRRSETGGFSVKEMTRAKRGVEVE